MNEETIVDIWTLFKEYVDKKQIEVIAESFVDLLADYGVDDMTLKDSMGTCSALDEAINYYLDIDVDTDDYDEWDE